MSGEEPPNGDSIGIPISIPGLWDSVKNLRVYYNGLWTGRAEGEVLNIPSDYVGGKSYEILELDEDRMNLIDLVEAIKHHDHDLMEEKLEFWWADDVRRVKIVNDAGLLEFFNKSVADDYGFIHLVVEVCVDGGGIGGLREDHRAMLEQLGQFDEHEQAVNLDDSEEPSEDIPWFKTVEELREYEQRQRQPGPLAEDVPWFRTVEELRRHEENNNLEEAIESNIVPDSESSDVVVINEIPSRKATTPREERARRRQLLRESGVFEVGSGSRRRLFDEREQILREAGYESHEFETNIREFVEALPKSEDESTNSFEMLSKPMETKKLTPRRVRGKGKGVKKSRKQGGVVPESILPEQDLDEMPEECKVPEERDEQPMKVNINDVPDVELAKDDCVPEFVEGLEPEEEYVGGLVSDDDEDLFAPMPNLDEFGYFVRESENLYSAEESKVHPKPLYQMRELEVGMEWDTGKVCRTYLRDYAIENKFVIKFLRNDNIRMRCVCKDEKCPWMCNCSNIAGRTTMVCRKLVNEHTCVHDPLSRNSMADAKWVARQLKERMEVHKESFTPKQIMAEIWESWCVDISYYTAWHGRDRILEKMHGSYEESYSVIPELARQLEICDPKNVVKWGKDDLGRFKYLCVAFSASLDGFVSGCRPLVGLDGCFLKGKYGGVCLAACALDANNGLFPLAIYICKGEDENTWTHFLQIIKERITLHPRRLTFISDRQKGLINAVRAEYGDADHRFCFKHMTKNFKKVHKTDHLEGLAWGAAKAFKMADHKEWMDLMAADSEEAAAWLVNAAPKATWSRAHFSEAALCEHISNNFSESFNRWILDCRDKPITVLVEKYMLMCMTMIYDRKVKSQSWDIEGLVPRAVKIIEEHKKNMGKYTIRGAHLHLYHVEYSKTKETWLVDINEQTCSCRVWDVTGLVCVHAVCVLLRRRVDLVKASAHYHSVKTYVKCYDGYVRPLPQTKDWEKPTETCFPPDTQRGAGRPSKKRMLDEDEHGYASQKKKRRCGNCGGLGHYQKKCNYPPGYNIPEGPARKKWKERVATFPAFPGGPPSAKTKAQALERQAAKKGGSGASSAAPTPDATTPTPAEAPRSEPPSTGSTRRKTTTPRRTPAARTGSAARPPRKTPTPRAARSTPTPAARPTTPILPDTFEFGSQPTQPSQESGAAHASPPFMPTPGLNVVHKMPMNEQYLRQLSGEASTAQVLYRAPKRPVQQVFKASPLGTKPGHGARGSGGGAGGSGAKKGSSGAGGTGDQGM